MSVWIKKTFLNIHLSLKVVVCFSTSRWRLLLNNWSSPLLSAHIPSDIKELNHLFWRQCICWLHAFCLGTICDIGVCSEHLSHVTKKKNKNTLFKSVFSLTRRKKKVRLPGKCLTSAHTFFPVGVMSLNCCVTLLSRFSFMAPPVLPVRVFFVAASRERCGVDTAVFGWGRDETGRISIQV